MSKIALRLYNRSIETLIDQGNLDEAIAHCQHVLKTYPKHLETYRLLGKAYLEAHQYSDAADIFQRVLMAVPDDFVSHLGMSILYDEQKNLEKAIWHMERAAETNPSNVGVRNELRRLYGRRDGLEPPKIRLTKGGLAQMYAKGGQYQQAIVEIKAILAADPLRGDLKALLARCYYRAGLKVAATETCTELLKQYPYHLDANRILAQILPGTSLAGSVEQYKRRVQALDPYAAFVSGSIFDTQNVPDSAVLLDALDYQPAQESQSWQESPADAASAADVSAAGEALPDWMQQAGWGPSTGEFDESAASFETPEPEPPAASANLAAAEIPDWLKAMAPAGANPSPAESSEEPSDADLDWLAGLNAPTSALAASQPPAAADALTAGTAAEGLDWLSQMSAPQEKAPASGEDALPDWLNGLTDTPPAPSASVPQPKVTPPAQPTPAPQAVPDWLKETPQPASVEPAADDSLDWLNNLTTPVAEEPQPVVNEPEAALPDWLSDISIPKAEVPAQSEPVADWLNNLSPEPANIEEPLSALVTGPGTSDTEQDEALKWLESLAEKQGANAEELITNPAERIESAPEWVGKVNEAPTQPPVPPAPYIPEKPIEVEAAPVSQALSPVAKGPGTSPLDQSEALNWLESLAEKQGAKAEELITSPAARTESRPEWVEDVQNPSTELSALVNGPGTTDAEQDDAMKWLESLAMQQGAKSEELITKPEERTQSAPEWVSKVGQTPEAPAAPAPQAPAEAPKPKLRVTSGEEDLVPGSLSELVSGPGTTDAEQDDAMKWLESLAMQQGAKSEELITKPEERTQSAPEWVSKVGQTPEAPAAAAPQAPAESQPEKESSDLDWLAGLAATPEPVEEAEPAKNDFPEWLSAFSEESQPAAQQPAAGQGELPDWMKQPEPDSEAGRMPWEVSAGETNPEPEAAQSAVESEAPTFEAPAPAETVQSSEDWFASLQQAEQKPAEPMPWEQEATPSAPEPVSFETPAASEMAQPVAESPEAGDVSAWLKSLDESEAAPAPAAPVSGETEELPDWLKDTSADEQEAAMPERISGWRPAAETPSAPPPVSQETAPQAESRPAPAVAPVSPQTAPQAKPAAPKPGPLNLRPTGGLADKDVYLINRARDYLNKGGLDAAMNEYLKIIKKGKLLEEVIYDLQEIVYRYPVDVIVWQTLGDAYMRSNRLQDALDAYTKAEELLR